MRDMKATKDKRFKPDERQITAAVLAFLVIAASILFLYLVFFGRDFLAGLGKIAKALMAIFYGIVMGYILTPLLNNIERKILVPLYRRFGIDIMSIGERNRWRRMRSVSIILTIALFLLIIVSTVIVIVPQLVGSIQSIVAGFPTYMNNVNQFIESHLSNYSQEATEFINNLINEAYKQAEQFLNNKVLPSMTLILQTISVRAWYTIRTSLNLFIGLIVAIYVLNSKETFCAQGKKILYALFKEETANDVIGEFRYAHMTFTGFFVGKIIDSIFIGIICFIGTSIIGTPYPILVSFVIGITNIIPIFGPYIGAVIGSILIFMINPIQALYFLIFVLILQQFDGNILGPAILGTSTGISSFWVIFAILLFGGIFGIPGWIIGVPMFAVFYHLFARLINHYLKAKQLPTDTKEYIYTAYIENGEKTSLEDADLGRYHVKRQESLVKKFLGIQAVEDMILMIKKKSVSIKKKASELENKIDHRS